MSSPPSSSSSNSGGSSKSAASSYRNRPIDPITRAALRYTISPREYELLHQYLISRAPRRVQINTPKPARYEKITNANADYADSNAAAMRTALRVFVGVYLGFTGWQAVTSKLAARKGAAKSVVGKGQGARYGTARLALSYSTIVLFHKVLHRFFRRLRAALQQDSAAPFRERNPRVAQLLTSQCTPAVGAALSGLCLGISPADQLRITIAIYLFSRSLEFGFNALEERGKLWRAKEGEEGSSRPWWFGSWMLMPFACGQLLHAFVFDRECFPESYGRFILHRSPEYIQLRPAGYPAGKPWPATFDIVDALAELSKLRWPPFLSPVLSPKAKTALPPRLSKVSPITGPAHPGIQHTSCALLHPQDPSCLRTYIKYFYRSFPAIIKFFTLIYGGFALLAYKSLFKDPLPFLNRLSARILRMSLFITGAIGTSWGSICLFNNCLPRTLLPTQRWFVGGFLGGMWAYVARQKERSNFLYSARLSIDSFYKVGKKRGWWRGVKGGDVLLFSASLALLDLVYEVQPSAVRGAMLRKAMGTLRGEGFTDRAAVEPKEKLEEKADQDVSESTVLVEKEQ